MSKTPKITIRTPRAMLMIEHLNLQQASGISDARWEKFQIDELNNDSMFALERKCRQVGWSFLIAMRGVADAILDKRSSVYNSINQKEAQDKIRYARAVYESLEFIKLPKIIIDNRQELEFENGARLISTAGGRGIPNSNFFIDEAAWKKNAREIFTAAVPVISKGGTFRIGSSTNGASGIFWEIDTESFQKYPDFVRTSTKWWEVEAFCVDVASAVKEAPRMDTAERVEKFATPRLKMIFANTVREDFQQEYEAIYVDETTAWITWDEIKNNTQNENFIFESSEDVKTIDNALEAIERFGKLVSGGKIETVFGAGVDVGRTRNLTEIFLVGISTTNTYPLRLMISLDNVKYDDQLSILKKLMQFGIVKMLIDRNGIGSNLAENMEDSFPSKAEGAQFALESKRLWATDVKMYMEQIRLPLPPEAELGYQIHSIKRKVTASANMVFDTEKNEKHHADKFWALALALAAANQPVFEITDRAKNILGLLK
ncbi:MAG TPA: terminase family protein [Pyrinomonadaceae bacterium]|nr:terminase family protein [Pyrinomonadaceae bacterium]